MSALIFSFECVAPLFLLVAIGYLLRRLGGLPPGAAPVLNGICYKLLLPAMLFKNAMEADFSAAGAPMLYIYGVCCLLVQVLITVLAARRLISDRHMAGSFVQGSFRPNIVIIGIPLAINMLGETGALPNILLTMLLTPLLNIIGICVLTYFANSDRSGLPRMLHEVMVNPLIIGMALGFAANFCGLRLPSFLADTVSSLSAATTPVAMIAIGARFELKRLIRDRRLVMGATLIKLVVAPLLITVGGILLGLRGNELAAVYIAFAVPTAATSGIIAEEIGCDGALANEIILVTTLFSVFSLLIGISLLSGLGLV